MTEETCSDMKNSISAFKSLPDAALLNAAKQRPDDDRIRNALVTELVNRNFVVPEHLNPESVNLIQLSLNGKAQLWRVMWLLVAPFIIMVNIIGIAMKNTPPYVLYPYAIITLIIWAILLRMIWVCSNNCKLRLWHWVARAFVVMAIGAAIVTVNAVI